ncbi:MAG: hypothetical protein ACOCQ5_01060 [Halanaerobiales bacterium]
MPLWFRCSQCDQIYYTANSFSDSTNRCEKCGGKLIFSSNKEDIFKDNNERKQQDI